MTHHLPEDKPKTRVMAATGPNALTSEILLGWAKQAGIENDLIIARFAKALDGILTGEVSVEEYEAASDAYIDAHCIRPPNAERIEQLLNKLNERKWTYFEAEEFRQFADEVLPKWPWHYSDAFRKRIEHARDSIL